VASPLSTSALRDAVRLACTAHQPTELPLEGRSAAGVMVLLREIEGEDHVLLQVRTTHVRHHKGEISLPGGRQDASDATLLHTALREAQEEVGVPPEAVEVWGQLDDTPTVASNYLVRPFVGVIPGDLEPSNCAPQEVESLIEVPLQHLLSDRSRIWKVVDRDGTPAATPAFAYDGHVIWGATARVLGNFLALIEATR
jgi:8-oxo-dGTP pyrophosphatase MutT (NUDIX family)